MSRGVPAAPLEVAVVAGDADGDRAPLASSSANTGSKSGIAEPYRTGQLAMRTKCARDER
jgi:hypothetical protein